MQQQPQQPAPQAPAQTNPKRPQTATASATSSKKTDGSGGGVTKAPRVNPDAGKYAGRKGEKAPQSEDSEKVLQSFLLKDLKPEDFEMETASAAIFTLVIGK